MKRVLQILFAYSIFCLLLSFVLSFFVFSIPPILLQDETSYKVLRAFIYFFKFAPAIVMTGFIIGYAVSFGRNPEGSFKRFSSAMFSRYRTVMIFAIVSAFCLTVFVAILIPFFESQISFYETAPRFVAEYIRLSKNAKSQGNFPLAFRYSEHALKLDKNSKEARELMKETEIPAHKILQKKENETRTEKTSEEGYTVSELRNLAERALQNEEFFNAHYFAETGSRLASPRNTNYERLREIAVLSWDKLFYSPLPALTSEQKIFQRKIDGYTALMDGDNLKAYYVFHSLAKDPDVVRYLSLAEKRLENESFFIDEIIDTNEFENARNIYFAISRDDGGKDIVFMQGMTAVKNTVGLVQYIRDFSFVSIDSNGEILKKIFVPYAKVKEIATDNFDDEAKRTLGIPNDIDFVPYLLLRSIDRNTEGIANEPVIEFGKANARLNQNKLLETQLVLPISYKQFLFLSHLSHDASSATLIELFQFAHKASAWGFSNEVFVERLLRKMLYPLFLIILLLGSAIFAWNYRLSERSLFQSSWILAFPAFSFFAYILYRALMWVCTLFNYALISLFGVKFALASGITFYLVVLVLLSIFFLARNGADEA